MPTPNDFPSLAPAAIAAGLAQIGMALTPAQAEQLAGYYTAVIEKNKVMNLTAITEPGEFLYKHYLDSYLAYDEKLFAGVHKALDLGTGGGFPGIPLAIYTPQIEWTLLDATAKKLRFIETAAAALGMANVRVLHRRAEDAGQAKAYREQFDLVVSRAVAALPVLAEWALPLVRVGGNFIAMKGPKGEAEVAAAKQAIALLGGELKAIHTVSLPGSDEARTLITISKTAPTGAKYPRKPGLAIKKPL